MKKCPRCNREYADDALSYCLEDGAVLARKYDADVTLINPYPPAQIVPPTVAYQPAPVTARVQTPGSGHVIHAPAPLPRRSPWLIGALVLAALAVGLTIGGFIFQSSSTRSEVSPSVQPDRSSAATNTTTPTPATATPTPASVEATKPNSNVDQSTRIQELQCVLYNNKSDKSVVNVRENCDIRNCELDASTIAGEYPDNTSIRVIRGSDVQTTRFTWVKVILTGSGRTVWVASSKIKCT